MLAQLIDLFTLLATLPNRAVLLTEAAFLIVVFLFALELSAPLFFLVGLIFKASALPASRVRARRALARLRRTRRAGAPIVAPARLGRPVADEPNRVSANPSMARMSQSDVGSITELSRIISATQSWAGSDSP